ncbi:MAG: Fe-S cluster assembly protein SufD [Deltaproteobacteria bacterium]|nr:Fe-S cluster assembly protein SufD [Deltaproteobacteria bacterium]
MNIDFKGDLDLQKFWVPDWDVHRLVFVDGCFRKDLSSLATLISDDLTLTVASDVKISKPVYILYVSTTSHNDEKEVIHHNIVLEKNSELDLIEEYASLNENSCFNNNVESCFLLKENSRLRHGKIQSLNLSQSCISKTQINLKEHSSYTGISMSWGAALSQDDLSFYLEGKDAKVLMSGLMMGREDQQLDQRLVMDHKIGGCESYQHFKCILRDKSKGLFDGKIYVRPNAQKTSAHQANDNLILSDQAVAQARPHLEIYADDVRCTHGSTTGQMDEEALFYMRSRGIEEEQARTLLIEAFADEIIRDIPWQELQNHMRKRIC